jgi:molybdopterin-synthase adenylyltransferase
MIFESLEVLVSLTPEQKERYKAQMSLPGLTEMRQQKLFEAKVAILGLNAVGTNCARNLAQAGVGHLTLIDDSLVQTADLASHGIFTEADLKLAKVNVLKQQLLRLNPEIVVQACFCRFDPHNAEKLLEGADLAVESLASWQDKLLASDCCMQARRPLIHSGLMMFTFHVFSMIPGRSACLRCVFARLGLEDFPPDGFNDGVLGAVASLAGAFQAAEAIKLITQLGTISANHLLRFDVLRSEFDDMTELTGRSDCPDCGRWGQTYR